MSFLDFVRAFVACYFIFVALHYTAHLSGLRARKNFRHAQIGDVNSVNGQHQIIFRVFRSLILLLMIGRIFSPAIHQILVPLVFLETPLIAGIGIAMMCISWTIVGYCQAYLNEEWRSGTAAGPADLLVTTGPYAISRNPIFAGVIIGQIGLLLAAPSIFTLVVALVGLVVMIRQAKHEETVLEQRFGPQYAIYRASVPRWMNARFSNVRFATR